MTCTKTIWPGLLGCLFLCGCSTSPTGKGEESSVSASYEVIAPPRISANQALPIVVIATNQNPRLDIWETLHLSSPVGDVSPGEMVVKRGEGSISVNLTGSGAFPVEIRSGSGALIGSIDVIVESDPAWREISGTLSDADLIWDSTAVIHLTGDTYVPSGSELSIYAGTRIEIDEKVRLVVDGSLFSFGQKEAPVLFTSHNDDQPWGEIYHTYSSSYQYTFFTNGGGDESRAFGHSGSQPVLAGENCLIQLVNAYIIDNPGKAIGINHGWLYLYSSLISRCDTGGELQYCYAAIDHCYFIDMPNGDGIEVDDDNDAIYLNKQLEDSFDTSIRNCVFVTGKDDGIDHNGASVTITNCVIEDFDNEGIAASNIEKVEVYNTLVVGCEQGIEAGYGEPAVTVDHCTLVGNDVGIRLGDSYPWGCFGTLNVTNTIVVNSTQYNVWNYDLAISAPREGAVTVTYSLVNQPEYDEGEGCLTGAPMFAGDYLLEAGSVGIGAASDGWDMGILP